MLAHLPFCSLILFPLDPVGDLRDETERVSIYPGTIVPGTGCRPSTSNVCRETDCRASLRISDTKRRAVPASGLIGRVSILAVNLLAAVG